MTSLVNAANYNSNTIPITSLAIHKRSYMVSTDD